MSSNYFKVKKMKLFKGFFGDEAAGGSEVNDEVVRLAIHDHQNVIDTFQKKYDAFRVGLFALDQKLLHAIFFSPEKVTETLIERNSYEELELSKTKNKLDFNSVNPIVEQVCKAKCYLALASLVPLLIHTDAGIHNGKKTFEYVEDLPRACIRTKYLSKHLNKIISLLNETPAPFLAEKEKSFFNLHVRSILDGAIEFYQHYQRTFCSEKHRDELNSKFNEHFVPRFFYGTEDQYSHPNTMTPNEIFIDLYECIKSVIAHLAKDPMYQNSLPNVNSLAVIQQSVENKL